MTLLQISLWAALITGAVGTFYAPEILGFIRRRHEARMPRVLD